MSEQRCWDCAHGTRKGPGAKTGIPDDVYSGVRCHVAEFFTCRDSYVSYMLAHEGKNCPVFKPREDPE
jgi:hypothetical protein